jgi:outer membrane murein-binding lipoprotein Lpp
MNCSKMIAAAVLLSLMLSGCDLVTETHWIAQGGW